MNIRPRPSYQTKISSTEISFNPNAAQCTATGTASPSSSTSSRVGLNWIDSKTNIKAKRPRVSLIESNIEEDESVPASGSSQSNASLHLSTNNQGILHRVTNTVSGLFNVSWSDWLKTSSKTKEKDEESHLSKEDVKPSGTSFIARTDEHSLSQLYPEEGVPDFSSGDDLDMSQTENSFDKPHISLHSDVPSFRRGLPFISSTPSLSPNTVKQRGDDDGFDGLLSQPSTSDINFQGGALPSTSDSISILKRTFPDSQPKSLLHSNGTTFPSSRKRLRQATEEERTDEESQNRSSINTVSPQLLSETSEVDVEPLKRKRPRFSISTYGSPLYGKRVEEDPTFSIFYPGSIMYGGASNHERKKNRIIPRKMFPRTPVSSSSKTDDFSDGGLSSAAKRILNCIDKISTPLSDSKRALPFTSPMENSRFSSTYIADFHKHRPTLKSSSEIKMPPATKLLTPSRVKINQNFSTLFEKKPNESQPPLKKLNEVSEKSREQSLVTVTSNDTVSLQQPPNRSSDISAADRLITTSSTGISQEKEKFPIPEIKNKDFKNKLSNEKEESKSETVLESKPQSIKENGASINTTEVRKNALESPLQVITTDNIQYSFAEPSVITEHFTADLTPETDIQFNFSSPISENEGNEKSVKTSARWEGQFKIPTNVWDCEVCLLQNDDSKSNCVACESPRPQTVVPTSADSASKSESTVPKLWGSLFNNSSSLWECQTCLIKNDKNVSSCIACSAPKPNDGSTAAVVPNSSSAIPSSGDSTNWGDAFKPAKGSWECSVCLLLNKESVTNCAACQSSKPDSSASTKSKSDKDTFISNSWGNAFKPAENSWECTVCLVINSSTSSNCVACQSSKPNSLQNEENKPNTSVPSFTFGVPKVVKTDNQKNDASQKDNLKDSWVCSHCSLSNKSVEVQCTGCKKFKHGFIGDTSQNTKSSSFSCIFGNTLSRGKDEWECETCLVRNKGSSQKCISCETPKVDINAATVVSEALTGKFKFGVKPKVSSGMTIPSVSFPSIVAKSENAVVKPLDNLSTAKTAVDVPKSVSDDKKSVPVVLQSSSVDTASSSTVPFSFFKPTVESKDTTPNKPTESSGTSETKPSNPLFQFGSSNLSSSSNTFGSSTILPSPIPSAKLEFPKINFTSTGGNSDSPSQPFPKVNTSGFNFFSNEGKPPSQPPTLGFPSFSSNIHKEVTTNSAPSTTSSITFAFGQQTQKPLSTGFNFGEAASKNVPSFNFSANSSAPIFQFGQPANTINPTPPQVKPNDAMAPAFLNIETPKPNLFNATGSSVGPQKRIIKKAYRRKQPN